MAVALKTFSVFRNYKVAWFDLVYIEFMLFRKKLFKIELEYLQLAFKDNIDVSVACSMFSALKRPCFIIK